MGDIRLVEVRNPTSVMSSQIVFVCNQASNLALTQVSRLLARGGPSKNLY